MKGKAKARIWVALLRDKYPHVGTCHAYEIMAHLHGYKTYAAFRAAGLNPNFNLFNGELENDRSKP